MKAFRDLGCSRRLSEPPHSPKKPGSRLWGVSCRIVIAGTRALAVSVPGILASVDEVLPARGAYNWQTFASCPLRWICLIFITK